MLKAKLYFIFFIIPFSILAQPNVQDKYLQKFTEIGIQAGVAGYAGDLSGPLGSNTFKEFSGGLLRPAFSINATHRMADWASFRPSLTFAKIAGDDNSLNTGSSSDPNRGSRNLNFRSSIAEFSVVADINPLYIFRGYAAREHNFYPYASVGLGLFYFNPQGNLNGTWYDLKPLRLEGQGFPQYPNRRQYSKVQLSIPVGAGFKYYISPKNYLGLEGMVRRTVTDYLDDVSKTYIDPAYFGAYLSPEKASLARELHYRDTRPSSTIRGNPKNDDYFFTLSLRFGFVLGG